MALAAALRSRRNRALLLEFTNMFQRLLKELDGQSSNSKCVDCGSYLSVVGHLMSVPRRSVSEINLGDTINNAPSAPLDRWTAGGAAEVPKLLWQLTPR